MSENEKSLTVFAYAPSWRDPVSTVDVHPIKGIATGRKIVDVYSDETKATTVCAKFMMKAGMPEIKPGETKKLTVIIRES